jgi:putative ABC transport system permease protein
MIKDYFMIAFRNLTRRRLRSWLTMLGIIIGITAVVSLISMGQGLKTAITSQFGFAGTDKLTISASGGMGPPGTGVVAPLTDDHLESIGKVNGVKAVASRLIAAGKMEYNKKVGFGMATSMPDEKEGRKLIEETTDINVETGRELNIVDQRKVVLGANLGEEDNGYGKAILPGSKILIQETEFEVIGILKQQGNFMIDGAIVMNEHDLRELMDIDDEVHHLIIAQVQSNVDVNDVKENIEKVMRKERKVKLGEEDFTVDTPQGMLDQINSTLFAVQLFVYIIASISILVGGIGIMNTMFTSVLERTREIGIMKSIGARNSAIFSLFFIESGLIGVVGGILGAIFGISMAIGLAALGSSALGSDLIKADINLWIIGSSIIGSFILGSIFGIIPAMNASKLHPVDALRHNK